MEDPNKLQPATIAIHADEDIELIGDVAPPLHLTTTFRRGTDGEYIYSREDQPTRRRLEAVLGALEGGHAVTFASGQAAAAAVLEHWHPSKVAIDRGYFGTHDLLKTRAGRGLGTAGLDGELREGDLVWLETPKNPGCELEDVAMHARRARGTGAVLCVDSTLATPVLQNPLALGADVVMHSSTKFLAGHSDALGGVLVVRDEETANRLRRQREVFGSVPGALEVWLTLRSIRTLWVRVMQQSATATRLAEWLLDRVSRVHYPALATHRQRAIYERQMRAGGGLLAFEVETSEIAQRLLSHLRLFKRAVSLGGVESLIDWRHEFDPLVPPTLLRLSVGLEEADDLITDLDQALKVCRG